MSPAARSLVIGHRGASGYRPEHTRSAYELAFALGADAVEPDVVATRDGVLVLRHENEISGTTDVARHPEFAERRTTKRVDDQTLTGWFTEDFTWAELATLRAVERLPELRPASTAFDGLQPILRLRDLIELTDAAAARLRRPLGLVVEIKHATHFAALGLPLDELVAAELADWDADRLVIESFEQTVLTEVRERGIGGRYVYLVEKTGAAADLVARLGSAAPGYLDQLAPAALASLAGEVDGVSLSSSLLIGGKSIPGIVDRAHEAGLSVFTWTLRPENRFLTKKRRRGMSPAVHGDWLGEFRAIFATGVDGVFADHPDLALVARDGLA